MVVLMGVGHGLELGLPARMEGESIKQEINTTGGL